MTRRNNKKNDPLGIESLLDSWMDMMSLAYAIEADPRDRTTMRDNRHAKMEKAKNTFQRIFYGFQSNQGLCQRF